MMFFRWLWEEKIKRKKEKVVLRREIERIEAKVKALKYLDDKETALTTALTDFTTDMKKNLEKIKKNIREQADEEKSKAWVDQRFEAEIDEMTNKEIALLDKFERDLAEYPAKVAGSISGTQLNAVLNDLRNEAKNLRVNEEYSEKRFEEIEKWTINERLRLRPVVPVGRRAQMSDLEGRNTNDGVHWKGIMSVAQQFGGWLESTGGGDHPYQIKFPTPAGTKSRPITVSKDISSNAIAKEIRQQLTNFLPPHKIPTDNFLKKAFAKGDVRAVA